MFGDHSHASVDGSFDEEAFLSEAGIGNTGKFDAGSGGGAAVSLKQQRDANVIEKILTAFYRATGIGKISDYLRGNASVCLLAWGFLLIAGVAHGLTHVNALATNFTGMASSARAVETATTALVYLVSGPSEFVDVSYELAVGNVNIHVLTTLAVWGTVLLGCALEGALLLVLFSTAAFVEMRLTGHARGDEAGRRRGRRRGGEGGCRGTHVLPTRVSLCPKTSGLRQSSGSRRAICNIPLHRRRGSSNTCLAAFSGQTRSARQPTPAILRGLASKPRWREAARRPAFARLGRRAGLGL